MLHGNYKLPCDVIFVLLKYAAEMGRTDNMRLVKRLGISWAENGILTAEAAEREVEQITVMHRAWKHVAELIGLKNTDNPTLAQQSKAHRWVNVWGFSDEMIIKAYERCIDKKGEFNIVYMNGVLKKGMKRVLRALLSSTTCDTRHLI